MFMVDLCYIIIFIIKNRLRVFEPCEVWFFLIEQIWRKQVFFLKKHLKQFDRLK